MYYLASRIKDYNTGIWGKQIMIIMIKTTVTRPITTIQRSIILYSGACYDAYPTKRNIPHTHNYTRKHTQTHTISDK